MESINNRIAEELGVRPQQVAAAVALLDEGSTVPFIARYRKEVTGSLDDTQLRTLEERLRYLRELEDRRGSILASIEEQGKLTPELAREIKLADTKTRLEDLYLPYKQKRRTKGQIALEAGLGELADGLFADPSLNPETEAARFIDAEKGFADTKAVLEGAKYILMERFAEDATLLATLRSFLGQRHPDRPPGSRQGTGRRQVQRLLRARRAPQGRAVAPRAGDLPRPQRGRAQRRPEGRRGTARHHAPLRGDDRRALRREGPGPCRRQMAGRGGALDLEGQAHTHLETDLLGELREGAETEAINVFARNLHDLLLAAPAGPRATLGLDPGLRTGCKVAVVDATGKLLETATVYPHVPHNKWDDTLATLGKLCAKHGVDLIAIGNGTASRETDKLAGELISKLPGLKMTKIMVSEAGASVYSASELAAKEFPSWMCPCVARCPSPAACRTRWPNW